MATKDLTTVRIAENQVTFREANEKIEATAEAMQIFQPVPFICECADTGCTEIVKLTIEEYENVREHPRRFFVIRGHAAPAVAIGAAVVAENHRGYTLVDKIGLAGEIAEAAYEEA